MSRCFLFFIFLRSDLMEQFPAVNTTEAQPVQHEKFDPIEDFPFKLKAAVKAGDFPTWALLFARARSKFNLPAQQLYDLVQCCPVNFPDNVHDLRSELLELYRSKQVLSVLTDENTDLKTRKFTTLLQLANFVGRSAYLKERAFTLSTFSTAGMIVPKEIQARIATSEKWNIERGGRYTEAELVTAGYEATKIDIHQKIFIHPLSHESLTVYAKDTLTTEDRAKIRVLRESARNSRRLERSTNPHKGKNASKVEKRNKK